jgi:hypothetical protein
MTLPAHDAAVGCPHTPRAPPRCRAPSAPFCPRQAALDSALNASWFKAADITRKREVIREKIYKLRDRQAAEDATAAAETSKAVVARRRSS